MKTLAPLAALAAGLIVSACDQEMETSRAAPMRPVLVAEAHYGPRDQAQVLAGVVKARIESDLAFRVAGKMATRLVDTGAVVHKGDPLAELDDADFRLQLEEAQAEQSSAAAALVQAEAEERRLTKLSKQGWTANADFDKARSAADQARAAAVRAERAVALARNAIDYATLRADADGVISAARVVLSGYDAEWAFIGAGVPEGAKVVALGVHKLDQGEKVRVVESLAGL